MLAGSLAALLILAPCTHAQDHAEPPRRPAPKPIAPTGTTPPAPPAPRDDSIPGLEDADFRLTPAPLRREGSFIVRQRGSMVRLPGGEKAFIFHKDAQGRADRPMVLLPSLTLQGMEQIIDDRTDDTVFLITGRVYAYHNVNYLLPTAAPIAGSAEPSVPPTERPKDAAPAAPTRDDPPRANDPAVQDLIRDLESQRERPRTLGTPGAAIPSTPPSPAPPSSAAAPPTGLLPENSTISLKRGRVVRLSGGEWAFAFDNGPSGDAAADRVLIVSPCLNLQRMESWAAQLGDGATLLLSGRIYQYQGRNHVIPTMYQITTPAELSPRH